MSFHIQRDGKPIEFKLDVLKDMVKAGELAATEYVYIGSTQKWVLADQVAELADAFSGGSGAAAKPAKKKKYKTFSETSWFMSAVSKEESEIDASGIPDHDEIKKRFSVKIADLD